MRTTPLSTFGPFTSTAQVSSLSLLFGAWLGCAGTSAGDPSTAAAPELSLTPALSHPGGGGRANAGSAPHLENDERARLLDAALTARSRGELLGRTEAVDIDSDLSLLTPGELACVQHLVRAGQRIEELYQNLLHPEAWKIRAALADPESNRELGVIYQMYPSGIAPIPGVGATPIVGVEPAPPGKTLYPADLERAELDRFLQQHPETKAEILGPRTVVRRARRPSLDRDRETLHTYPVLAELHRALADRLDRQEPDPSFFYAIPYAIAYPEIYLALFRHINAAATAVRQDDPAFARYLRARAHDLLRGEYDGSDALWVATRFRHLNAQIGSYESYSDHLYGVKSFPSLSILLRDLEASEALANGIAELQSLEDALPYAQHKQVRSAINVGIYNVVADFGQSRSTNTASILPNEAHLTRSFGRTILLRANLMRHPQLFARKIARWQAAVDPGLAEQLSPRGAFERTLWHEIGHYLGVDRSASGQSLDVALQQHANTLEEMKADLVALHLIGLLEQRGHLDAEAAKSMRYEGIRRTLQSSKKSRSNAYATMQLMQFNYFQSRGVIVFDPKQRRIWVDLERQADAVRDLLADVLELQWQGDPHLAGAFIDRWATWNEQIHGALANAMHGAVDRPYTLLAYPAVEQFDAEPR